MTRTPAEPIPTAPAWAAKLKEGLQRSAGLAPEPPAPPAGPAAVRLALPGGRTLLAPLPRVPRAGEIVDLAEPGAGRPLPYDVVAVRWGVGAAGGYTGVTLELRPRS